MSELSDPTQPPSVARHPQLVGALSTLRFLASFAAGTTAAVRILHFDNVGITPAQVGILMAGYSVILGLSEVPSGAIADVWGRRNAKIAGSLILILSTVLVAVADSPLIAGGSLLLLAFGRALSSGSAESWFVDEIGDPDAPVVLRGLARAEAAHNIGTAAGAVIGGLLPFVTAQFLSQRFVFAPAFTLTGLALLVEIVMVIRLVRETAPVNVRDGVVATTIKGVRNTLDAPVPRWVIAIMVSVGAATACVELLTPVGLADGLGFERAGVAFGAVVAASWGLSALTASRTTSIEALLGSAGRAAGVLTGLTMLVVAPAALTLWFGPVIGYVGLNLAVGPLLPLLAAIIHRHVASSNRSTGISTVALAFMVGAAAGATMIAVLSNYAVLVAALGGLIGAVGLLRAQAAMPKSVTPTS